MIKQLSEDRKSAICMCEDNDCKYTPLKHFEKCPLCKSVAYHRAPTIPIKPKYNENNI